MIVAPLDDQNERYGRFGCDGDTTWKFDCESCGLGVDGGESHISWVRGVDSR